MANKEKQEVEKKEVGSRGTSGEDEPGGGKGDELRLKVLEAIINTPDEQLSSMTSLQPNLVVPLAMMEMYDKLFAILLEDIERYAKWLAARQKYIEERKNETRTITIEVLKEVQPSEESGREKRGGLWRLFGRRRQPSPVLRRVVEKVEQTVIAWGPTPTVEEIEEADLRDMLTLTLLTRAYRLSLYKHRRSVGGIQKMAAVELAKEEMAMLSGGEEPGDDWSEP